MSETRPLPPMEPAGVAGAPGQGGAWLTGGSCGSIDCIRDLRLWAAGGRKVFNRWQNVLGPVRGARPAVTLTRGEVVSCTRPTMSKKSQRCGCSRTSEDDLAIKERLGSPVMAEYAPALMSLIRVGNGPMTT